jgi:hypothetical protein
MKFLKELLAQAIIPALTLWLVCNFISLGTGVIIEFERRPYMANDCDKPATHASLIVPGFQIGCWLGQPIKRGK